MEVLVHIGRESVWGAGLLRTGCTAGNGQDADAEVGRLEELGEGRKVEERKVEEKGEERRGKGGRKVKGEVRKKGRGER